MVGQLARQVKLKEKDFIENNTKNQGRVSECPKENEFRSGGQNCTTSEPENVREMNIFLRENPQYSRETNRCLTSWAHRQTNDLLTRLYILHFSKENNFIQ